MSLRVDVTYCKNHKLLIFNEQLLHKASKSYKNLTNLPLRTFVNSHTVSFCTLFRNFLEGTFTYFFKARFPRLQLPYVFPFSHFERDSLFNLFKILFLFVFLASSSFLRLSVYPFVRLSVCSSVRRRLSSRLIKIVPHSSHVQHNNYNNNISNSLTR